VDPLGEKYPSLNPYHYVANSPLNRIDLDGRIDTENTIEKLTERSKNLKQQAGEHREQAKKDAKEAIKTSGGFNLGLGFKFKLGPFKIKIEGSFAKIQATTDLGGQGDIKVSEGMSITGTIGNVTVGFAAGEYQSLITGEEGTTNVPFFKMTKGDFWTSASEVGYSVTAGVVNFGQSVDIKKAGSAIANELAGQAKTAAANTIDLYLGIQNLTKYF